MRIPRATRRPAAWSSTEHNLDVYAAFTVMARLTGEHQWQQDAAFGGRFIDAMWDSMPGCYLQGPTIRIRGTQPPVSCHWTPRHGVSWRCRIPSSHTEVLASLSRTTAPRPTASRVSTSMRTRTASGSRGPARWRSPKSSSGGRRGRGLASGTAQGQQTAPFGSNGGIAAASHDGLSTRVRVPLLPAPARRGDRLERLRPTRLQSLLPTTAPPSGDLAVAAVDSPNRWRLAAI